MLTEFVPELIVQLQHRSCSASMSLVQTPPKWSLVDSMTQAPKYLRDDGMAQNDEEVVTEENERVMHRPRPRKALYPV
jgi:hypothetical protein